MCSVTWPAVGVAPGSFRSLHRGIPLSFGTVRRDLEGVEMLAEFRTMSGLAVP